MSANRVQKRSQSSRSSSKISSEKALAAFVSFAGFESSMPCTNCFRNGRSCIISSGSSHCGECIGRKVHCDGNNFAPSLMRSIEEEKLREQVLALNTQLLSTMSRKRRARERAGELFRRGMVDHEKEVPDPRDPPAPASQASGNDHPPSTSAAVGTPDWLADVDWSSVDPDWARPIWVLSVELLELLRAVQLLVRFPRVRFWCVP
ncbi:hypothetical protein QBC37DRAFT_416702 [Rhypophila decipiens]|uniref:Zn(2)-C6 fungal-type domain-containing protein n=1 Tax=Rhypophila decipiens TaxID=261697 RepID=A0AAN6YBS9_9PEZI|nr:hypothetical protein QBC37DRAFT_416702 [Rhypophila decipiens]